MHPTELGPQANPIANVCIKNMADLDTPKFFHLLLVRKHKERYVVAGYTYVFLYAASPRLGKLSNPHESPTPPKNHLKQLQKKLMLRYFPRQRTCFLQYISHCHQSWKIFKTLFMLHVPGLSLLLCFLLEPAKKIIIKKKLTFTIGEDGQLIILLLKTGESIVAVFEEQKEERKITKELHD